MNPFDELLFNSPVAFIVALINFAALHIAYKVLVWLCRRAMRGTARARVIVAHYENHAMGNGHMVRNVQLCPEEPCAAII